MDSRNVTQCLLYAAVFPSELLSYCGWWGGRGGVVHIHLVKRGFQLRMEIFRLRVNCLRASLSRWTDMWLYLPARQGEINVKVSGVCVCVWGHNVSTCLSLNIFPRVCLSNWDSCSSLCGSGWLKIILTLLIQLNMRYGAPGNFYNFFHN